ncbi:MAG: shikimate dehydrogenase, partial [Corynebacterium casei]
MPRAAVLGQPIAHSMSPILHSAGYKALGLDDWSYSRIEANADTLPSIVADAEEDYRGFSVTMPGKFAALNFATTVTERARLMGSANTLVRTEEGWQADNTDTEGV